MQIMKHVGMDFQFGVIWHQQPQN